MKLNTKRIAFCGVIAAVYAAVTISTAALSYGPIQFRISEALCVLPFFLPYTTFGLFAGCLIANIFSTVSALDIIIGSAATLIGCLWTSKVKNPYLAPLPTVICNWIMVGAMLAYVYTPDAFLSGFITMGAEVAVGEAAVMGLLGLPLTLYLDKTGLCQRLDAIQSKNS